MKALVYRGPYKVAVEEVPDPRIEAPGDAIIKITTTNICGSDLHMYEGRTAVEEGKVLGHENMGTVVETGSGVTWFQHGDRVSVPFNIACGTCRNCVHGWTSFCLRMNPVEGVDGAAYGYAQMGPYQGGQAEYLRVPFADFNLLKLPPGTDQEPRFHHVVGHLPDRLSRCGAGRGGPRRHCRCLRRGPGRPARGAQLVPARAARVFVAGQQPDRLALAEKFGATPVNVADGDPAERVIEATNGLGADRGIEAVGYQAHDSEGQEHPEMVMDNLIRSVRSTGGIGVVGVYVPQDPWAATEGAQQGRIGFDFGTLFQRGQEVGTGQCPVKRYNEALRDLIIAGKARPSMLVSHEVSLDDAPGAYEKFDQRADGYTKVLLHPAV